LRDSDKYWAAFAVLPDIGPSTILRLFDTFEDMSNAWRASRADLLGAGLASEQAEIVLRERARVDPDAEMDRVLAAGATIVTFGSGAYPPLLREIPSPPALLYVKGELIEKDKSAAVGIVGTRRVTPYGRQITERLAGDLAALGVTIVSGLALGIDAVAHESALDAGGRTVAVLGTGIDRVYPERHIRLAERISESGALVTEFPPGTGPAGENFPRRNRIISGLSLGTVVTEAPLKSGALITASFALDQGREVMAVPGDVFSFGSAGCNALLREGATLVRGADDVLEALNFAAAVQLPLDFEPVPAPEGDESRIAVLLSAKPLHLDDVARTTGLSAGDVAALLTVMELKGLARDVGGGNYVQGRSAPARA